METSTNSLAQTLSDASTSSSSDDEITQSHDIHYEEVLQGFPQEDFGRDLYRRTNPDSKRKKQNKTRKIKVHLYKGLIYCLNREIKKIQKSTKYAGYNNFLLLRVNPIIYSNPNKRANKALLKKPIKYLFNKPISSQYHMHRNHNRKIIKILENNPEFQEIKNILNMSYLNILRIYRGQDEEVELLDGLFGQYINFIEGLRDNPKNDEDYIDAIREMIDNFEHYFH